MMPKIELRWLKIVDLLAILMHIARKNALIALQKNFAMILLKERITMAEYESEIKALPAADVAPVVRCKDCKYGEFVKRGSKYSCRKVEGFLNFHNFYCKDGARKEDAE